MSGDLHIHNSQRQRTGYMVYISLFYFASKSYRAAMDRPTCLWRRILCRPSPYYFITVNIYLRTDVYDLRLTWKVNTNLKYNIGQCHKCIVSSHAVTLSEYSSSKICF